MLLRSRLCQSAYRRGTQPVHTFSELDVGNGHLRLLTATDCVKDRLAAFYHWDDLQSLEQATLVAKQQSIELENIRQWSENEGYLTKFEQFKTRLDEG